MSDVLPASAEGELRDLERELRSAGQSYFGRRLERIVDLYSGCKAFREMEEQRRAALAREIEEGRASPSTSTPDGGKP